MAGTGTVFGGSYLANTSQSNNSGSSNAVYGSMDSGCTRSGTPSETHSQSKTNSAGTFSFWTFSCFANSAASTTAELRVGGSTVTETVSIGSSATGQFVDSTHTDSISSGNLVGMRFYYTTGFPTFNAGQWCILFTASSGAYTQIGMACSATSASASTTSYMSLVGTDNTTSIFNSSETGIPYEIRAAATASNYRNYIQTNTSTNAVTSSLRVTGGNGAETISIASNSTGAHEDTTHTDSLGTTDTIGGKWVTGASTSNTTLILSSLSLTPTGTTFDVFGGDASDTATIVTTADTFIPLLGSYKVSITALQTEADTEITWPFAAVMSHLRTYASVNSGVSGTMTHTFRSGGSDKSQTVTITNSTTGLYEDTTHTDTLAAGALITSKVTHPTAGSVTLERHGITANSTVSSTETGTVIMAFGPFALNAAGARKETATTLLAFGPLAFAAAGGREETGTAGLAFGPVKFNAAGGREEIGTAALAFGPLGFVVAGYDILVSTLRQFWTR